jgi:penicillin-binding protein 2
MAQYPPGSIFKLVDALIGQHEQVLFPETRYPCYGGYPPLGGKPKCHPHASPSDLRGSIRTSCNSYYSYVFRSIVDKKGFKTFEDGYNNWRNHILSFGIGKKLGTDLPHELSGNVPTVEYYNKYFGKNGWKSSTIVSLGIGQAELGILPVQMANVMCVIANKGYYFVPHIIKKLNDKKFTNPEFIKKNYASVDEKYYDAVIDGMEMAVQAGTAAASKIKDISMCGKTGTAQNPHGKDHSVFVAFAPRENPKIAIAVVVENAGFGGTWAAPIASLIIEKYLTDSISRPHIEERMLNANLMQSK